MFWLFWYINLISFAVCKKEVQGVATKLSIKWFDYQKPIDIIPTRHNKMDKKICKLSYYVMDNCVLCTLLFFLEIFVHPSVLLGSYCERVVADIVTIIRHWIKRINVVIIAVIAVWGIERIHGRIICITRIK